MRKYVAESIRVRLPLHTRRILGSYLRDSLRIMAFGVFTAADALREYIDRVPLFGIFYIFIVYTAGAPDGNKWRVNVPEDFSIFFFLSGVYHRWWARRFSILFFSNIFPSALASKFLFLTRIFLIEDFFGDFLIEEIFVGFLLDDFFVGFLLKNFFTSTSLTRGVSLYSAAPEYRVQRK